MATKKYFFTGRTSETMPVLQTNYTPASAINVKAHRFKFYDKRFGHAQCQSVALLGSEVIDTIIVLNRAAFFKAVKKTVNIDRFNYIA
jgi:hypothetical protein